MRRLGALLGVLVAASIAASCGESVAPQEGPKVQADGRLAADKKVSESANDAAPKGHEKAKTAREVTSSEPAVNEMSVFSRPRTEEDVLPRSMSYLLKEKTCSDWFRSHGGCLGDEIADESRLLLTNLGVRKTSLYAWPTTNGWVCWGYAEGGASCFHDFAGIGTEIRVSYAGIDPDIDGSGAPGTLVGVVPDDVASATVTVLGGEHPAQLGNNAVFYELPDGACTNWAFEALTATYADGRSATVPITWHEGPKEMPATCAG